MSFFGARVIQEGRSLYPKQRKVVNRLLDGFEGKLSSSKWAKLPSVRKKPRTAISSTWSSGASWRRTMPEAGAQATRSPNRPARPDQGYDCLHDTGSKGKERSQVRRPGTSFRVVSIDTMVITKGFGALQAAGQAARRSPVPRAVRLITMRSCHAHIARPWLSVIIGQEASRR